ncbi:MAG: hypothetical protein RG741_06840 [Bacteroidales bacterium]|nr:hypothetical protein [Bacteroidales bacterium]
MKALYRISSQFVVLSLLLMSADVSAGQPAASAEPQIIIEAGEHNYMNARWSPDGSTIAFTADQFTGLWLADSQGKEVRQLSNDAAIGFGFSWSPDGTHILGRSSTFINNRRFQEIKIIDVNTGAEEVLLPLSRNIRMVPVWSMDASHVAVVAGNSPQFFSTAGMQKNALPDVPGIAVFSDHGMLYFSDPKNKTEYRIAEFEGRNIFNLALSPTGDKAVFQLGGLGLHVINTDGSGFRHLGHAEQASWMPDGRHIIATLISDDGYRITGGVLYAIDVLTGQTYPLTENTGITALRPEVSPCGNYVLFDNPDDGNIYLLELK